MAVLDIYSIEDRQTFLGQSVVNVYYYQDVGVNAITEAQLADIFEVTVIDELVSVQATNLVHDTIRVTNLTNPGPYSEYTIGTQGEKSSEPLPRFNAWGFRFVRDSLATRNGYKRIAGVTEDLQSSGVATSAALTLLNTVTGAFLATLSGDSGNLLAKPVIVGRNSNGTYDLSRVSNVVSVVYYAITTQNSRKR